MTGDPTISKRKHASFSEASVLLCDELKQEFPTLHVSCRLPRRVHSSTSSYDVDIVRSEEDNRQLIDVVGDVIDKHEVVGPEVEKHVDEDSKSRCVRSDNSHAGASQDVGSFEGQTGGCFEDREGTRSNVGSFPSSSTSRRPRRQLTRPPKKKRGKFPTALAPISTDPTGPPAQVVVPPQCSYILGAPNSE